MNSSPRYVVTTRLGTQIWDSSRPFLIGHPFQWVLEKTKQGIRIRELSREFDRIRKNSVQEILDRDLKNGHSLRLDRDSVKIRPVLSLAQPRTLGPETLSGLDLTLPDTGREKSDPENIWYRKVSTGTLGALLLFSTVLWLIPDNTPEIEQTVIPPQFAKIVMAKAKPPEPSGSSGAAAPADAAKRAQKTAVVQAFRAKSLQNSVSKLLKGGMTQLLSHSSIVSGAANTANAKTLFNSRNPASLSGAPLTGLTNAKQVEVAAIGGAGGGGNGEGVGYGKGEKAGVAGQGSAFVDLDLSGGSVEEGLTRDEVGRVIHAHLQEIRYCYESAMIRNASVEGRLVVDFVIGGNGRVKTTAIQQSTLEDPRLDDCVIRRLVTWKFPQPKGGVDVGVSYPFLFKTLGR